MIVLKFLEKEEEAEAEFTKCSDQITPLEAQDQFDLFIVNLGYSLFDFYNLLYKFSLVVL